MRRLKQHQEYERHNRRRKHMSVLRTVGNVVDPLGAAGSRSECLG